MCYWFFLLLFLLKGVFSLRLVSLHVPKSAIVGDAIKLTCGYDLESDTLYSIKWYRNDVEFYRFVPRDKPPGQFFPLNGVTVDIPRSTNGTLVLRNVDTNTSGTYKCEVSADAPSFQTVSTFRKLIVQEYAAYSSGCSTKWKFPQMLFRSLVTFSLALLQFKPFC